MLNASKKGVENERHVNCSVVQKYKNTGYLEHTVHWLQNFLADYRGKTIAFVPYAGVRRTFDEYEKTVQNALSDLGMILFPFIMVNSIEISLNKQISSLLAAGIHFVCKTAL